MNQTQRDLDFSLENTESVYSASDIITVVVIGLNVVLIIALNILCLLVLRHVKNIKDTTKVFLQSLNSSDLIVGIFPGIPTLVLLVLKSWPFGEFLCTVHAIYIHYTNTTSICSLLLLTGDRYMSVVFPLRYPALMTVARARIAVCFTWLLMLTIVSIYGFAEDWSYRTNDPILGCGWSVRHTEFYNYLAMGFLLLAVSIVVALYARMFVIAHQQSRRIAAQAHIVGAGTAEGPIPHHRIIITRSTKTVFIITIAFMATIIPSAILLSTREKSTSSFNLGILIGYGLFLSNSWVNFLIYFMRNEEFRQEARKMFPFRLCITNSNAIHQT